MTYTPIIQNGSIEHDHTIFDWYEQLGWSRDQLVDPADMTPKTIRTEPVIVVTWEARSGPVEYAVDESHLTSDVRYDEATAGVEFGSVESIQPIDFSLTLNQHLPEDLEQFQNQCNERVTVFAVGERGEVLEFSQSDSVDFLGRLVPDSTIRREVLEALCEPFDVVPSVPYDKDEHGEYVRAHFIMPKLANAVGDSRSPDSGISGHKKRNRQRFYRNFEILEEHVQPTPAQK